ncbi:hypothetical protein L6452_42203 [Arctium lappa]|uniref:Uncharacterized protein n=1 Tax=Arctium lappa TaxID=4217 RepID=A0ACB8XJC5_ARCLA|nr:hypothetical protein L6452_42203 [Arctium lappa]
MGKVPKPKSLNPKFLFPNLSTLRQSPSHQPPPPTPRSLPNPIDDSTIDAQVSTLRSTPRSLSPSTSIDFTLPIDFHLQTPSRRLELELELQLPQSLSTFRTPDSNSTTPDNSTLDNSSLPQSLSISPTTRQSSLPLDILRFKSFLHAPSPLPASCALLPRLPHLNSIDSIQSIPHLNSIDSIQSIRFTIASILPEFTIA